MTDEEDRSWVKERWEAMIMRLRINNVDRCWEIVQEVWARRDAYEKEGNKRSGKGSSTNSGLPKQYPRKSKESILSVPDELDRVYTVRGELHWLKIMKDREWEGMFFFTPWIRDSFTDAKVSLPQCS